jgi:DegV family protein with EDD domain
MFGIVCDSGSNVPELIMQKFQIRKVPLRVILGKNEYRDDGIEITEDQLLNFMQKGIPRSSLPFYDDIVKCFEEMITEGYTKILAINLSSGLSGTYNSFQLIAKKMMKKYPHVEIAVFDSFSLSIGTGLIVYKAAMIVDENPTIALNDLVTQLSAMYTAKNRVYYVIPTLKFLIAGGRIGRIVGTIGEWLHFKPILSVSAENGAFYQLGKEIGLNRAIDKIVEYAKTFIGNQEIEAIGIYHSGKSEETLGFVKKIQEKLAGYDIPKLFKGTISSTLLVHVGPGLVGLGVQLK